MKYKGHNIGLNYDAATGTWVFSNEPQDFVDTNAFSTPDPVFKKAPVVDDDDDEDINCPEGYIYDNTLKQCVPDPSVQNNYTDTTSGSDKEERDYAVDPDNPLGIWIPPVKNADGTWEAGYTKQMPNTMSKFTQKDLVDWGKSKGYITKDGTIVGAMQASDKLGMYKGIGQFLNDRQYNSWLKRVQDKGMAKTVTGPSGTQGVKLTVSVQPEGDFTSLEYGNTYKDTLTKYANNAKMVYIDNPITKSTTIGTSETGDKAEDIILKEKAKQEQIKTEKEEIKKQQEQIKTQEAIRENEYNQQDFNKRDNSEESGGSYGRDDDRPEPYSAPGSGTTGSGNAQVNPHTESGYSGGSNKVVKKGKAPSRAQQRIKQQPYNIHKGY